MKKTLLLHLLLAALFVKAQSNESKEIPSATVTKSRVHIVTSFIPGKNKKLKFSINGETFILKDGHCMDYTAKGDSVIIEILHKPLLKAQYPINLHVAARDDIYVFIKLGHPVGKSILGHRAALEVCEACYVEMKKDCR